MNILVCVKQIRDPDVPVHISGNGIWVDYDADDFVMNRFDAFALEEAILIREEISDACIHVVSVGPDRVEAVLRRSLGMEADHGIHLLADADGYVDPFFTAGVIADFARNRRYDLILTGVMSGDDMNGMVGPLVAEMLDMPCATSVIFRRMMPASNRIYVEREVEGGLRDVQEMCLPAVLTIQSGINQPRYPVLSKMLRARKYPVEVISARPVDMPSARLSVVKTDLPRKTRAGRILEGTPRQKADQLLELFHRRFGMMLEK